MSDDNAIRQHTLSIVQSYLALLSQGRWNEWGDLWADDSVLEFPYAPEVAVSRYVGRDAIVAYMSGTARAWSCGMTCCSTPTPSSWSFRSTVRS